MSQLDSLMAAVCAAPEDMAPRRAYAAAVKASDPDRARLIDLQLDLRDARRAGKDPDATAARELVKKRGTQWAGSLAKLVDYFMFWGGFVEEIEIELDKLLARNVAELAPIRHLRARELAGKVPELLRVPVLGQLRSLDLQSNRLTDVDLGQIVQSPKLAQLRMLRIGNNPDITIDGLRLIARAKLPELRFVDSTGTRAQLVNRTSDWDGSDARVSFTRAQGTLVDELGALPWLTTKDEPSLDAI